jgi:hypothetical protein
VVLALAVTGVACDQDPATPVVLPRPSVGRASPVPGQPPVVWLAAQTETVTSERIVVIEPEGPRVRLQRLAGDATKFFVFDDGEWAAMPPEDAVLIEVGTPLCVEALLDGKTYLALRVFVGGACGPAA